MIGAHCANVSGDIFTLYVSDKLDHTVCRLITDDTSVIDGGRFRLNDPAAGTLTGIGQYGSTVLVFTGGKCFLFTGDQASNFALTFLVDIGCTSHRSIVSTRQRIIWLAYDGVYAWNGGPIERISEDVKEELDALSALELSKASALIYHGRYHLYLQDFSLVYDLKAGIWSKDTNVKCRDTAVSTYTPEHKPKVYGARSGSGWVWELETGNLDDGEGILCRYSGKDHNLVGPDRDWRVHKYGALFRSSSTSQTVSGTVIRGAGESIQTATIDLSAVKRDGATVVRFEQGAVEQARDEFHRLAYDCLSTTGEYEILGSHFELTKVG